MNKKKAVWWFFPSLLEPCDGPWGTLSEFGHDTVLAWKGIIDWAAKLKVSQIITGIEPYSSDRVYNQWGFHYVCHFPDDPAARCFDEETIKRNIKTIREICSYAQEKNVLIMFHHYNLMAPERWVQAHPSILEKYNAIDDPVWGRGFRNDRMGFIVSNICWNEPEYKKFLLNCWQEVFANIPELGGAVITAGEFNYCGCDVCTGGSNAHIFQNSEDTDEDKAAAAKALRMQKRGEMCLDLIESFTGTMKTLGKEAIVRTWVMSEWIDLLPKGIDYVAKYSVFDACWGGPDPVINKWLEAGHNMWESVAIEAENCGPVIWHDDEWCKVTGKRNNDMDIQGCIIHINTQWGHKGHIGSFTASQNITRLFESLEPKAEEKSSVEEFKKFFGEQIGEKVCRAAQLIATFPLHMTATVHLKREGFSYGMPPWFDGNWRWPGVLGGPRYEPEEWANPDGLTTINEMVGAVSNDPENYQNIINLERKNAISRCDEIALWCGEARKILEDIPMQESTWVRSELKALEASARIAEYAAAEHAAVLRSRLAWEAVKKLDAGSPVAVSARKDAVKWYAEAIEHLRKQISWGLELNRVYPDLISHIIESHETFNRLTMTTRLRIREEELRRIKTVEGPDWEDKMTVSFWDHLPNSIGSKAKPKMSEG